MVSGIRSDQGSSPVTLSLRLCCIGNTSTSTLPFAARLRQSSRFSTSAPTRERGRLPLDRPDDPQDCLSYRRCAIRLSCKVYLRRPASQRLLNSLCRVCPHGRLTFMLEPAAPRFISAMQLHPFSAKRMVASARFPELSHRLLVFMALRQTPSVLLQPNGKAPFF